MLYNGLVNKEILKSLAKGMLILLGHAFLQNFLPKITPLSSLPSLFGSNITTDHFPLALLDMQSLDHFLIHCKIICR